MIPYQNPYQYLLDSSALFDLKRDYPISIFPSLWDSFNNLCQNKIIVAPREVLREIKKGNDELVEWAHNFDEIFLEPVDEEVEILQQVMSIYPANILQKYSTGIWADPLLVAAGKYYNIPIIQHESTDPNQYKIPSVAARFGVRCIKLIHLFDEQSWRF